MRRSPSSSTSEPAPIGSQMRMREQPVHGVAFAGVRQEPAEQHRQPDHHPEGIGVEVAALHTPQQAAEPFDRLRRAVDHDAIDQRLVATLPQADTDPRVSGTSTRSLNQSK